ncbi:MAG: DUF4278 domain-containing protein [Kamptonema sp. SIO4C4]|nr:DUF4278 domain-containing protein [Kamptonema sp. SIO4C4]
MKLFYRGHSYEAHNTSVPTTEERVEGKYRGKAVQWNRKHARVRHNHSMTYRGVHYNG